MSSKTVEIPFSKMTGTGNDFIVIDNRGRLFRGDEEALFRGLCRRRVSIGADGLILVEVGKNAPVRMRYFNADGRESTMCGNGARCTALFALRKKFVDREDFTLEAPDGLHPAAVGPDSVLLYMSPPGDLRTGLKVLREAHFIEGGFIDTGVPHYVIFAEEIEKIDVEALGKFYRHHPVFPEGTNVNFVQTEGDRLRIRTFERGVEGETLSCGTGCVASALIASRMHGTVSPTVVDTRGGRLRVTFDESWTSVGLEGAAGIVFEGTFRVPAGR